MDATTWLIIAIIAAPIIGGIVHTAMKNGDFASLGDIKGMPIDKIIARVGQPTSISAVADGQLYQWLNIIGASGSHYAILVDMDGNAIGYTHQYSS